MDTIPSITGYVSIWQGFRCWLPLTAVRTGESLAMVPQNQQTVGPIFTIIHFAVPETPEARARRLAEVPF